MFDVDREIQAQRTACSTGGTCRQCVMRSLLILKISHRCTVTDTYEAEICHSVFGLNTWYPVRVPVLIETRDPRGQLRGERKSEGSLEPPGLLARPLVTWYPPNLGESKRRAGDLLREGGIRGGG